MSGFVAGPSSTFESMFNDVPENIDFDFMMGKVDVREWNDDKLKNKSGIKLVVLDTDAAISKMTRDAISCLHSKVTEKALAQLMVLAWNTRSPKNTDRRVFPNEDPTSTAADSAVEDVSDATEEIVSDATISKLDNVGSLKFGNEQHVALAGPYVALSLLRLFSKPSNSYIKAWDHLAAGFRNFYGIHFPFPYLNPDPDCISFISTLLRNTPIFVNTLTAFLYSFESLETADKAMCSVLYEQHLAFTGLHSYNLFMRARTGLKLESKILLGLLKSRVTEKAVETIECIINNLDEIDDQTAVVQNKARKTWKYARIFDHNMFLKLQTKNCKQLTCVLAHLCVLVGEQGTGNVLSITQLNDVAESLKVHCGKVAQKIYDWATEHHSTKARLSG